MDGIVNFEEPGMPWTAVRGTYRLITREIIEGFGDEPHWLIDLGDGDQTYVPESSVMVIDPYPQMIKNAGMSSVACCTDQLDGVKIDVYESGEVRLHVKGRTIIWMTKDIEPYVDLTHKLNDLATGGGEECELCKGNEETSNSGVERANEQLQ